MDKKEKEYYEKYLKKFGDDASLIGRLVKTVLDQEKRITALEKKQ